MQECKIISAPLWARSFKKLCEAIEVLFCFRYGSGECVEMKKGLKAARHVGLVHVKFNVSKDVASHIQQSVCSSWKQMQDLGVVSVKLDDKQLACVNPGQHNELSDSQSLGHQHCALLSYPFNGCAESIPVHDSCYRYKSTRGKRGSRAPHSRGTKRRRNDGLVCQCTGTELCSSTVSAVSVAQEGIGDNTSQRYNQDQGFASYGGNERVLRVSSSQLPYHVTPSITDGGSAVSTVGSAVSLQNSFTYDMLQFTLGTANAVHSHDLPLPSTPYVPKRRKRRKPADDSSQAALAKSPLCTKVEHARVPVCINSGIEVPSKLFWPKYVNQRFQLNGHCPPQFSSPAFSQYAVVNRQRMPLSVAGSCSPVALANYARLPTERHMVLDSCLPVSSTVSSELRKSDMVLIDRNVPADSSQLLQPQLGSADCSSQNVHGLLHQSVVAASSDACYPKLFNHFSQGSLGLRHRNPEMYGNTAETKNGDYAERSCQNVNSQLCDVSSALTTERNLCSQTSTCTSHSVAMLKPTEMLSSSPLFSEVNTLETTASIVKSLDTVGSSSVESSRCSVVSTASVCCSGKTTDIVIQSETLDRNLPMPSSAVVKKCKSDTVNGYHMSDYTRMKSWQSSHKLVSASVAETISKQPGLCVSAATNDDISSKCALQTAVDHSSVIEPMLNKDVMQANITEHFVNMHSHSEPSQCH